MIDSELLPEFVLEAGEHLDEMEANLIKLETNPEKREIIDDIFRDVHTIKGSSAYLGLQVTSELAHKLENLLEMVRQGKRNVDSSLINTLIAAKDSLTSLVADIESYQEERTGTDDLIEIITNCSNASEMNDEKVENSQQEGIFEQDVDSMTNNLDYISIEAEQNNIHNSTDFSLSRKDNLQEPAISFSEEELSLNLDDIFATEENQSDSPYGQTAVPDDIAVNPPSRQDQSAQESSSAPPFEPEIEELYEETGDEELFSIYLEQLKIKVSDIRQMAVQIPASENRSEQLSAINKKIERLKASANYMGYDKLTDFFEHWQAKLETFQDRLFLNDAPSCEILIEEGINSYFHAIKKLLPQLQTIKLLAADLKPCPASFPSPEVKDTSLPAGDNGGEDGPGVKEGSLTQMRHSSPIDNTQEVSFTLSEEELKLDLDGIFGTGDNPRSDLADTIELTKDSPTDHGPVEKEAISEDYSDPSFEPKFDKLYEETGDEELFSIYLEQLKIKVSDIRQIAVKIPASENRSEQLSAINKKIERLKASANYMGYDKLAGFYEHWQEKLETFQDRLFLNDTVPCNALIEEGINTYLDTIKQHFPQLQEISQIQEGRKEERSFSAHSSSSEKDKILSPDADGHEQNGDCILDEFPPQSENEYEENIDTELFSIFLEQLKDAFHTARALGQQLSTSENPFDTIGTLTEKIIRIRAAANYMGYDTLTRIYDEWVGELKIFRDPSSCTLNEIEIVARVNNCIRTYTDKLLKIFPQIDEIAPLDAQESNTEEQLFSTSSSSKNKTRTSDLPGNTLLVDRTDELFSSDDTILEDENVLYQEPEETENEATVIDEDQILVDRLSSALDDALGVGVADPGGKDLGALENMGSGMEPYLKGADTSDVIKEIPEEKTASLESQEPPQQTKPDESVEPAPAEEAPPVAAESVERRKEERRQDDRRVAPLGGIDKVFRQSLRIDANKIDELMNQAGELVINRAWFSQLYNELKRLELHIQNTPKLNKKDVKQVKGFSFKFHEAIVALGRVANELQESVMKVRMLPISQLFNRYPRLIRDLVHDSDKDIHLVLRGADTELDKMIIEEIADPLIHVIRNAVDHGIESVSTRRSIGKPEKGRLKLDAYHEGSHVVIEVIDDGRGINLDAIKSTALNKGVVNREQLSRMSPKEVTELIMRPGFSTAGQVTRTSGRGVGMDVVRKNLENLNGTIEIDSQAGKGTRIRIKIPLTLAVIKALMVKVRGALFTIPLIAVDETLQVRVNDIHSIKGNEVIYLRDNTIPLIRLSTIFNFPNQSSLQPNPEEKTFVVIVSAGNSRVGLVVDELRGQEEVVIKPLPDYLRDNKGFSGATILGDGGISLILDIHELVNLTIGRQNQRLHEASLVRSETL